MMRQVSPITGSRVVGRTSVDLLASKPLIITAAITGAETTKAINPNLPVTPEEQGRAAAECVRAGASIIHLHVRDKEGRSSQRLDDFRRSIEAIRGACEVQPIIQISTSGAVDVSMNKRLQQIAQFAPEMASLNVATITFGFENFINTLNDVESLAVTMQARGVVPEVEIYDLRHLSIARRLEARGKLTNPVHLQFVMGVLGGIGGEAKDLAVMIENAADFIEKGATWAVAGVGRYELGLAELAVAFGGHVRVGFEDNVYIRAGERAESNAQLVRAVAVMAERANRPIATPDLARELLDITPQSHAE